MAGTDIAVVGGGVIGCAIARALADSGLGSVAVFDRGMPGQEASAAAAGVLAVASSRAPGGALFDLRCTSARLFPDLVRSLEGETGLALEYRTAGLLEVAFGEREALRLAALVEKRHAQGFAVRMLAREALAELEPGLHPELRAAALFDDDHSVHAGLFTEALRRSAEQRGASFRAHESVRGFEVSAGRIRALVLDQGRLPVGHVVIAAGAWSGEVGTLLGCRIPVRPDRGEMIALRGGVGLGHVVVWNKAYLVPRGEGEVLVGSTSTRGTFEKEITARHLALLAGWAIRIVPALADALLSRTWAGLRPCPTIRRPILGPVPGIENLTLAVGHHRSGVLLAPITAQLVAELLTRGETSVPLLPFSYRRR